ncbi:MAG: hypothetical protein H6Q79_2742, partial [Deltaproteobacteria bacterium]|nr:hypothetical protein [Deltaproteobacteria bacterium]
MQSSFTSRWCRPALREVKQVGEGRRIGQVLDQQDVGLEGLRQAGPVAGIPLLRLPPVELDIPLVPEPVALLDSDDAKAGTVPLAEHGEQSGGDPLRAGGRHEEEPVPLAQNLFGDVELAGVEADGGEGDPRPQVGENLHDHLGPGETPQETRLEGDDPGLGLEVEDRLRGKVRRGRDARKFQKCVEQRLPETKGEGEQAHGSFLRAALDHHVPADGGHPDARHPAGRRVEQDLPAN